MGAEEGESGDEEGSAGWEREGAGDRQTEALNTPGEGGSGRHEREIDRKKEG